MARPKKIDGKTAAELSRMFDVNRSTVTRHVQSGNIISIGESEKGSKLYDPEQAGPFLRNAILNSRKIDSDNSSIEESSIAKPVHDEVIPVGTEFDEWLIDLFGSDFSKLDDQKKLSRSRSVREARMAALADIETKKARGLLIEKETVGRQLKMISASWCATLHTFPSRWSSDLVAMTNQHEIKQYLIDEMNNLIDEVLEKWRALEDPEER
ncbi:hypothetical protein REA38_11610 [Serratia sp. MF2]|uniref:hypothetical protein n=1 Tax=Serratia sp. MF1(2023) TaxID=3059171 RepID=UPI0027F482E3|nr:hypothetical protein [Serratia sp. MF1(2023)]MDQ7104196.1 hypothetical protein [Serratia sp. MF1(2023)]